MKIVAAGAAAVLLMAASAVGQEPQTDPTPRPNAPKFVKSVTVPWLKINYVDFKWDEAAFQALETGGDHPAARRSWVLARLMVQSPVKFQGRTIPVGSALLVLNPARAGAGPTLDVRYVDMREIFVDMNVIAEPPQHGDIYGQVPAAFAKVSEVAPRLAVSAQDKGGPIEIAVHYGDRRAAITLTR